MTSLLFVDHRKKKKRSEVEEEADIDVQVEHAKKLQLVVTGKKGNHKQHKISDSNEKDNVKISEDNDTTPVTNKYVLLTLTIPILELIVRPL